jgi:hypothetical protein
VENGAQSTDKHSRNTGKRTMPSDTEPGALLRLIAAYDRHVEHPEIYEDLKDE